MIIRKAQIKDCISMFELIKELAIFEKGEHEVINTASQLEKDGFGENPLYHCIVADLENKIVGLSLYYFRYSTWKGKRLYLEDLIVSQNYRGQGIGRKLLDATLQAARDTQCSGAMWQVLDWNKDAIDFYKTYKAKIDTEWYNCTIDF